MIAMLAGMVDHIGPEGAVVDVGGVGYLVFCSAPHARRSCRRRGEPARLLVETHVREDHIHLYGFVDEAERDWFRLLTTVQGVGGEVALAILSARRARTTLTLAIVAQDKAALTRADGVGPKLAAAHRQRVAGQGRRPGARRRPTPPRRRRRGVEPAPTGEAVSALVNLGYRRAEAFGAVAAASRRLGDGAAVDALIRAGLQELAQGAMTRPPRGAP